MSLMDYTVTVISTGAALLGLITGSLGTLAVVRKQSLIGDSVSHAALPGIVLAFILTGSKSPLIFTMGAIVVGWIGTLIVQFMVRNSRLKFDTALASMLSVFFGLGLMLISYLQKTPDASQAGLEKFLFGQAATLMRQDLFLMLVMGIVAFFLVILFWNVWKVMIFNPDYAQSIGIPVKLFDALLTFIQVIAIVIGLQIVGVVLMSAMLIAPAVAARHWSDKLGHMMIIAGVIGAVSSFAGATLSTQIAGLPTGPVITISVTLAVVFSVFFASGNGMLWKYISRRSRKRELSMKLLIKSFYELSLEHEEFSHPHDISVITLRLPDKYNLAGCLERGKNDGFIGNNGDKWFLTKKGLEYARKNENGGELYES